MSTKRADLPFSNPIGDSVELMQKMWGFAGLPGMPKLPTAGNLASMAARIPQQLSSMMVPTLDVDELAKRIADLRAVEQWLELNAGILRTTIQSLEVQRATIATLKGFSGAMLAPMLNRPDPAAPAAPPEVALGLAAMEAQEAKAAQNKGAAKHASKTAGKNTQTGAAEASSNPAVWWNTLQDQFARLAATASGQAEPPVKPAKKAAKRRAKRG